MTERAPLSDNKNAAEDQTSAAPADDEAASLSPAMQSHIGLQLRALYDEVTQEAIPDRFVQLLAELERKAQQPK